MPPIKPEPIETSPETNPQSIKPEPTESPPDLKSEPIDYDSTPPSKRAKTLTSDSPSSKGKSKIIKEEDHETDSDSSLQLDTCGVCLLEQGMSLRGFIDSCEHYFCFVCIMEWAKVESRCPVCKQRFSIIRRPQKDGVFESERIVNVPVRNQIHYFNGNATIGPPDPYSQVKCSVCSLSSDDELLLLCDLCDSAAHSYCVGLGATVPEGDWFCKDCTLSRDEHAKVENNNNEDNDNDNDNDNSCPSGSYEVRFERSDVSVHDIVRETYTREPRTSFVPPSVNQSETVPEPSSSQPNVDRSNARTLQRCANVHSRIRVLRENWEGFRGGSVKFSKKEKSTSQKQPNSDVTVDKAWKMMDIATKALGKKCASKTSLKFPVKNERLVNDASTVKPCNSYFQGLKINDSGGTSKNKPMKQNYIERELPSSRKIIAFNVNKSYSKKEENGNIKNIKGEIQSSGSTNKICSKKRNHPQVNGNITEVENAKSEIRSLVKLNLKLLSRHKKLEIDVFKEVARHSTHSIMAACGIEPLKPRFHSFERLVCNHNETDKRPISTLMPTSCRECFFVFVKDVVTAIASDRTGSCKV